MRLSERFFVPDDVALLYDFVNTLDLRRYMEHGEAHVASDEIDTPEKLETWLRKRKLLGKSVSLSREDHGSALALRQALRVLFALAPEDRATDIGAGRQFNAVAMRFPLTVRTIKGQGLRLQPFGTSPVGNLGLVLAEVRELAAAQQLDRMKMCGSDECGWIFFDRSKPANRRWCSSARCGNREKTRTYRNKLKQIDDAGGG